jgi:hypothetical protein
MGQEGKGGGSVLWIRVVDPKLFFPDPDLTLTLISDPDPVFFMKNTLEIQII